MRMMRLKSITIMAAAMALCVLPSPIYGLDPLPDEVMGPVVIACTRDAKICPDGSAVGRDASNNCEFYPCPDGCQEIDNKDKCKEYRERGCRWLYGVKKCVNEDSMECSDMKRKGNCKMFDKCRWRKDECVAVKPTKPLCPVRRKNKKPCPDIARPVRCGLAQCQYSNICEAKASGFKRHECRRVCKSDKNCQRKKGEICYNGFDKKCDVDCKSNACLGVCIKSSGTRCGGFAGFRCPLGEMCVDKKGDNCSPNCGGADCGGICVDADCPKPGNAACPKIKRPVVCGNCEYQNFCLAKAAGYEYKQCHEKKIEPKCPESGPAKCPRILRPVLCGPDACRYSNDCLAEAAGFKESQCKPERCTRPCPQIRCPYGTKPGKKPGDCCDSCIPDEEPKCPLPEDAVCGEIYSPVLCGKEKCEYENPCVAKAAGYGEGECRKKIVSACPVGGPTPCPLVRRPVICGPHDCQYPNECVAEAAGFKESQCKPERCTEPCPLIKCATGTKPGKKPGDCCDSCIPQDEPKCPEPEDAVCEEIYSPVLCGKEKCEYENQCLARAAGYGEEKCRRKIEPKCPESGPAACPKILRPVFCGPDACRYSNDCLAEAAGFKEFQCKPEPCTRPCPQIKCSPGYKAVKENPDDCCYTKCVKEDPCFKPDCSRVLCKRPECEPNQVEFTPRDQCCPTCVDPVFCKAVPCRVPVCDKETEELVKRPDQCCATCEKKCVAPDPCKGVLCPQIKCAKGYKSAPDPNNPCCNTCVKDPCYINPTCLHVRCASPNCGPNQVAVKKHGACCKTCVNQVFCKRLCPEPKCTPDEVLVKHPDQCCATCEKKCLRPTIEKLP